MAPQHASLVSKKKEMPITTHDKSAGDGYNKGSPLYEKQQEREKSGAADAKPKPAAAAVSTDDGVKVSVPSTEDATNVNHWLSVYGNPRNPKEGHLTRGLAYFCSYFIMTMLVALIWIKCTSPGRTKEGYDERKNNSQGFAYGLFSLDHCFGHHASVCLCSWCCTPLRLADTYSKEPSPLVRSFWVALVLITCLLGLQQLTFGFTGVVFMCVAVYYRQLLRKKYALDTGAATVFQDILSWICCPFCSMAQEARQVEFVIPIRK
jgi:Cys-rich protein (TIGR01571 family)